MRQFVNPIYVTQPSLPPLDEFFDSLKKIWESKVITNNGSFHKEFEQALADYLGVKYLSVFANGTLALMTALQTLQIEGEVITTPFSFVATTNALWWNRIDPVFVDIETEFFNLDPGKIEAAITPRTTAIVPVHVYGNPCDVTRIQRIADTYGLKIIYDAAHAFGVKINGIPILEFGDLSVLSFHATKVFNTIEGGAIICHDEKTKQHVDYLKNFGFADEVTVLEAGINGKMNELQAAYGLLQLKYVNENIEKRREISNCYRQLLGNVPGLHLMKIPEGVNSVFPYFSVIIDPEVFGRTRDQLYEELKKSNIYCRRYFYPLISQFPMYSHLQSSNPDNLKNACKVSQNIICLPIFPAMTISMAEDICFAIKSYALEVKLDTANILSSYNLNKVL